MNISMLLMFALTGYHWVHEGPRGVQKISGERLVRQADNRDAAVCLQQGEIWKGEVVGQSPDKTVGYKTVEECKAGVEAAVGNEAGK